MRHQISILFFLILLLLTSCNPYYRQAASERNSRTAFSFYYKALDSIQEGDFQTAVVHLDSAIHYQPAYSNFYFVKGRVFDFLQEPDSAIKAYERSVQLRSSNPKAWIRLGELYLSQKDYQNAASNFRKAVQNNPDSLHLYLRLGESYFRSQKYYLALDRLKEYEQLSPNPEVELRKWQGLTYVGLKEYRKAADLLATYLRVHPNDSEALKYFGMAKFHLGDYNDAISALNKAGSSNVTDPEIYLYRARYFLVRGKKNAAREQLEIALQNDSLNTTILFELGMFHFNENELEKSRSYFRTTIQVDPTHWQAHRCLGIIAEQENNLEEALLHYKLYLENTLTADEDVRRRIERIQSDITK